MWKILVSIFLFWAYIPAAVFSQAFFVNKSQTGIIKDDFVVNDDSLDNVNQIYQEMAMDAEGNFIIVWTDRRLGEDDIWFQRFDALGNRLGSNTKVNTTLGNYGNYSASVSMDSSGNFIISWSGYNDRRLPQIYFQRFNRYGVPFGANKKVSPDTTYAYFTSSALHNNGKFIISWEDPRYGYFPSVFCQIFDDSGIPIGSNLLVNDTVKYRGGWYSKLTIINDEKFAVTWQYDGIHILLQIFNNDGHKIGPNIEVDDDSTIYGFRHTPAISKIDSNRFVISWADNDHNIIFLKIYDEFGNQIGSKHRVNNDIFTIARKDPQISYDGDQRFIVTWNESPSANQKYLMGQQFSTNGTLIKSIFPINKFSFFDDYGWYYNFATLESNSSRIVFCWGDNRHGKGYDIYCKIVTWDWNGLTNVEDVAENPTSFVLYQNYPNPFNPSTVISYQLSAASHVNLKVFDVLGREVARNSNEVKDAGTYNYPFSISRVGGQFLNSQLNSGVYIYKLTAGNFTAQKKMIVLK